MNFFNDSIKNEYINPDLIGKACNNEGNEYDLKDKIKIRLEIYRMEKLVSSYNFYNQLLITNLFLYKSHDIYNNNLNIGNEKYFDFDTYHILVNFDMSEVPDWIKNYKQTDNEEVSWSIRVQSNESIKFYVDTTKEDKENYIKECWENPDPGRKDRAKYARNKYLINKKKENGKEITLEDQEILNIVKNSVVSNPKIKLEIETDMKNIFNISENLKKPIPNIKKKNDKISSKLAY
jgi:hypothetical protein